MSETSIGQSEQNDGVEIQLQQEAAKLYADVSLGVLYLTEYASAHNKDGTNYSLSLSRPEPGHEDTGLNVNIRRSSVLGQEGNAVNIAYQLYSDGSFTEGYAEIGDSSKAIPDSVRLTTSDRIEFLRKAVIEVKASQS